MKNLFCVKALHLLFHLTSYADFMLLFELLFCDIKNTDISIPQTKAVKSNILDTAFSSFHSFNNNKMKSKEELKALHNLRKQKYLVIQKAVAVTEKNAYINKMKEIISDKISEQINIEEDKKFNFVLKSEKKVIDLIKSLENQGKIREKESELIYLRVLDQVFCTDVQKSINHLSIAAPNSVLFCQQLEHLLTG